ncbi:MAG: MFS transporter [Dehalococcoidia bacterium]
MQQTEARRGSPFEALKIRDYRWYWFSGLGMTGAQNIQRLAMAWLILDLTGSLGQLGLMVFLMGLPMTLTSLWGGVLADRYDRRLILTLSQAFTSINLVLLALLTMTELVHPAHVYVSSVGLGVMQALTQPARSALVRSLVAPEQMRNAVALNTIQMQSAQVVWPSVAGGMIALFGVGVTLTASAALSVLGIVFLQIMRLAPHVPSSRTTNQLRELVDGLKYCLSTPRINALLSMGLLGGCFGFSYTHVAPGYSREILGFNAGETGLFLMASGIGSIAGSMVMLVARVRDNLRVYFLGAASLGLSIALLAVTPWPLLAMLPNAMFGAFLAIMIVSGQTVIQTEVPPEFLGRVTSIWTLCGGIGLAASLPVGAFGDLFGLRYVLAATGLLLVFVALTNGTVRTAVLRAQGVPARAT